MDTSAVPQGFPSAQEAQKYYQEIRQVAVGDPDTSLGRTSASTEETVQALNDLIEYHDNLASIFKAMSAWFSRDSIGLPGLALFFKIRSQMEINESYIWIDFMSARGEQPEIKGVAKPPRTFNQPHMSDVLHCFELALAMQKVQVDKLNRAHGVASSNKDSHLTSQVGMMMQATGLKINQLSHYVSHLKCVEHDKHAIKAFDRRIPYEFGSVARGAGIDAGLPARMMVPAPVRAKQSEVSLYNADEFSQQDVIRKDVFQRLI
jgi:ferritin heavy chain